MPVWRVSIEGAESFPKAVGNPSRFTLPPGRVYSKRMARISKTYRQTPLSVHPDALAFVDLGEGNRHVRVRPLARRVTADQLAELRGKGLVLESRGTLYQLSSDLMGKLAIPLTQE